MPTTNGAAVRTAGELTMQAHQGRSHRAGRYDVGFRRKGAQEQHTRAQEGDQFHRLSHHAGHWTWRRRPRRLQTPRGPIRHRALGVDHRSTDGGTSQADLLERRRPSHRKSKGNLARTLRPGPILRLGALRGRGRHQSSLSSSRTERNASCEISDDFPHMFHTLAFPLFLLFQRVFACAVMSPP